MDDARLAKRDVERGTVSGRILVVDDEPSIRLVCRVNLGSLGLETIEAANGTEALELARAEQPDLVVLDIMLPELDGWQVAEQLAASPETHHIPVLFITARAHPVDELRSYGLGGIGHVAKPFDPEALSERVRSVVERVRAGERETVRAEWLASLRRD